MRGPTDPRGGVGVGFFLSGGSIPISFGLEIPETGGVRQRQRVEMLWGDGEFVTKMRAF